MLKKFSLTFLFLVFILVPSLADDFDFKTFAKLPVLLDGRVKPWDTVGRNSLLIMQSRQRLKYKGKTISPQKWVTQVVLQDPVIDQYQIFDVRNPETLAIFDIKKERTRISFAQYLKFAEQFDQTIRTIQQKNQEYKKRFGDSKERPLTAFEKDALELYKKITRFHGLRTSLNIFEEESYTQSLAQQRTFFKKVNAHLRANDQSAQSKDLYKRLDQILQEYKTYKDVSLCRAFPILGSNKWQNPAQAYLSCIYEGQENKIQTLYASIYDAYRKKDTKTFNQKVSQIKELTTQHYQDQSKKNSLEVLFNKLQPFYLIIILYIFSFLLASFSWLGWKTKSLQTWAKNITLIAFVIHTLGLVTRVVILEYAPVINLYSSAVFVGWGSVLIALFLERIYKNSLGSFCAGVIGSTTGIIAHNLSLSGDTLQMMQAVLDNNFWLSTHVICVTIGYSGTFFAGAIALFYILMSLAKKMTPKLGKELCTTLYGVVCFATLTSFVGTVLGGIWADQSWGRFWGWDPKENGALLVVFWNVLIIHCRWSKLVKERGLVQLAIFGNVITALAWFGVNMLSVGLHSYGFNEAGLAWLVGFCVSQLILIGIAEFLPSKAK